MNSSRVRFRTDLRRAASRIAAWWQRYRVERRNPELAALRKAEAIRRRQHRPVRDIHTARREIVIARLRAELGVKQ